jgi:menaquinone-specific isochorismate synthase
LEERRLSSRPTVSEDHRWTDTLSDAVRIAFLRADEGELLVRVGVPVGRQDAFKWLEIQEGTDRVIWGGRHRRKVRAMIGAASIVAGSGKENFRKNAGIISDVLNRSGDEMRYYGGLRFDPVSKADDVWSGFEDFRFVLPRFELHATGDRAQIYCNLIFPEDRERQADILRGISALRLPAEYSASILPLPIDRKDSPGRLNWIKRIRSVLGLFENGPLQKIVLARRVDFTFQSEISSLCLLKRLVNATPNCFHFHFESRDGGCFLGATPERLFYRNGRQIESEAVAGTRPRGENDAADEELRNSLLTSDKERREHAFVRDSITDILGSYCSSITIDREASEMRLARGRHLVSRISGVLEGDVFDSDLIDDLHPTPAVGGHPTSEALRRIGELEEFDRGWYAGPIGWFGRDSAEFAVALRCGIVRGNRLSLFSGAGIVKGSEPEAEWAEIEQKTDDFLNVLGLELKRTK